MCPQGKIVRMSGELDFNSGSEKQIGQVWVWTPLWRLELAIGEVIFLKNFFRHL